MQRTELLGVSMTHRSQRRVLVVSVYLFLVLIAAVGLIFIRNPRSSLVIVFFLVLGIRNWVFGALVPQDTFVAANPMGHTEPEPEVRDRAHFIAFRIAAIYSMLLWLVIILLNDIGQAIPVILAATLVFPLIVMAVTLPQAVVLWTEPDVLVD
jgi:hypothetical protein